MWFLAFVVLLAVAYFAYSMNERLGRIENSINRVVDVLERNNQELKKLEANSSKE